MTTLFFDLNTAIENGELRRPHDVVKALGIAYERWEPQPIADQIKLHGCTNVPAELPSFIRVGGIRV